MYIYGIYNLGFFKLQHITRQKAIKLITRHGSLFSNMMYWIRTK